MSKAPRVLLLKGERTVLFKIRGKRGRSGPYTSFKEPFPLPATIPRFSFFQPDCALSGETPWPVHFRTTSITFFSHDFVNAQPRAWQVCVDPISERAESPFLGVSVCSRGSLASSQAGTHLQAHPDPSALLRGLSQLLCPPHLSCACVTGRMKGSPCTVHTWPCL